MLFIIPVIVFLSIIHYHVLEKSLQKCSFTVNFIIAIVFSSIIIAQSFMPIQKKLTEFSVYQNVTTREDSINYNEYLYSTCLKHSVDCTKDPLLNSYFPLVPDAVWAKRCVLEYSNHGNQVAVLAGNSFISAHAKAIVQAIKESRHEWKFKKIYILSQAGCPIFDSLNEPETEAEFYCPLSHGIFRKFIHNLQPDLLIMMNRMDSLQSSKIKIGEENFHLTERLTNEVKEIAASTKNWLILEPNFVVEP